MPKGQYSSRSAMRRARLRDFGYWRVSEFNRRVLMSARGGSMWSFRAPMKRCTVLGLIICLVGCTTLQPVTGNPAALQQRIASGELLKRGDRIDILTKDGRRHDFNVTSVSASTIDGKHESIPIDQVAFIQKRKLSVGKTALFTVVVAATVVVVTVCIIGRCRPTAAAYRRPSRFAQPLVPAPPPPLAIPPESPQFQTCTEPASDSKNQVDGGKSTLLRRQERCTQPL